MINSDKNILIDIDEKLARKPVYKKMLNNLLGISARDNSIFASSKINNMDVSRLVSSKDLAKVYNNKNFIVTISDTKSDIMLENLIATENFEEFINIADEEGMILTISDRKLLEKSFIDSKVGIINKLKKEKNQKIAKWKRFRNKYLDKQVQTNSWPLYVGTMIMKVKTISSTLYAPLVMKKVEIKISQNNKVQIQNIDDSIELNEKLLFLLQNEYKINVPNLPKDDLMSLNEGVKLLRPAFDEIIREDIELFDKFEFLTKNEVINQNLQYAPGVILSLTSPSGGKLRDKLIDIMMHQDPDELLDIDVLKDLKMEIEEDLQNKKGIFRITNSDLSQEKAILGSLKDNSIIWGPPGTGKSQTISNILANILINENTAIVTSEKKAALDVIQKRMGKLAKYMFFGLTDKNIDKKAFYKPFNDLIDKIITTDNNAEMNPTSFILDEEWDFLKQKKHLSSENLTKLSSLYKKITEFPYLVKIIDSIYEPIMNNQVLFKDNDYNNSLLERLKINGYTKRGFLFFKRYPKNIRKLIKYEGQIIKHALFRDLIQIKDISNLDNVNKYLEIENNIISIQKIFESDIDYIDKKLAEKFRERIIYLKNNPEKSKRMNTFLKNCKSGYRIPYKFVDLYKDIINSIFYVFVSTPQTLAGTIDMNYQFDFAIFDEASQLHLEKAIPFIAIAEKSIIAGDQQQMRPTSYFGVRDKTSLLDDTEENVDSLLDYAYRKGLKSREYMLTKNYRSKVAELMTFSSKKFYNGDLDVVDNANMSLVKAIEVYDVKGVWEGRVNGKEAKEVLQKLLEVVDSFKKIIILTLNSTQKQYVEGLIYSNEKYNGIVDMLRDGKVVLRNLENIQGDEADLVIVSVAYDKTAKLGSTYVARPEGKNALNVAISRAIEKMIVFKSIKANEVSGNLKNESLIVFREWLEFLESSKKLRAKFLLDFNKRSEQFDSTFEEEVYDKLTSSIRLNNKAYIQTQYQIGSYVIDMAIFSNNGDFLLGVEVDGYKYHSGFKKMTQDIERQMFIESKGYSPIYRITELNWKINKKKVIDEINNILLS